ncbi:MAG: secretin [Micavibrio sp.]|nr:MAG: secretin [Micavibrio sp.]
MVMLGPTGKVWAAKGDLVSITQDDRTNAPLKITLGKAELIDLEGDVSDILVADPSIVDVVAIQSRRLYMVGSNVGDTNVITLDANGDIIRRIDVHVQYDVQAVQSLLESLFPDESPRVSALHDQILLTGTVSTPEAASKIQNLVAHYVSDLQDEQGTPDELISNLLEVRGEQQVMLQVKIIEATRSVLKEFGLETNFNDTNELSATTIFGGLPSNSVTSGHGNSAAFAAGAGLALSQDPTGIGRALIDTGIDGIGTLGLFLNALEEENMVNILAEPNLTAVSGEQAGFLAGGEFPVPVGRDQVGNLVIEFREFGVSLNFRPVVMSDKRISLQMNTEVSSLDFDNAITLADTQVPGLDVRRAETTVEIPSGGSLMIAGLLQSQAIEGMSGLPGISKTPVLGDLVSSDSFQREETELVVIVTSYLVEPYADKAKADHVPVERDNPLAISFAANIRRAFGLEDDEELFAENSPYGYLLD